MDNELDGFLLPSCMLLFKFAREHPIATAAMIGAAAIVTQYLTSEPEPKKKEEPLKL